MLRTLRRGSRLTRLFVALSVFVSSVSYGRPTSTTAHSLLEVDLHLDHAKSFGNYVGWPAKDAELMLDVFQKRIPVALEIIDEQDQVIQLQDEQHDVDVDALTQTASIASSWKALYRQKVPEVGIAERILNSREVWLIVGIIAGVGAARILTR